MYVYIFLQFSPLLVHIICSHMLESLILRWIDQVCFQFEMVKRYILCRECSRTFICIVYINNYCWIIRNETKYFIYSKSVGLRREGFTGGGNYCPLYFGECDQILLLSRPSSISLWFFLTTRQAHVMNVPSMMLWCFSSKQWIWSVLLNKGLLKFDVNTKTCLCLKCYLAIFQEGNEGFTPWIIQWKWNYCVFSPLRKPLATLFSIQKLFSMKVRDFRFISCRWVQQCSTFSAALVPEVFSHWDIWKVFVEEVSYQPNQPTTRWFITLQTWSKKVFKNLTRRQR